MSSDAPQGGASDRELLAYCLYAAPVTAIPAAILNFVPAHFAETYGLPLAAIGSTFLLIRIIDALVDPLLGWAIDSRPFGRQHRPWLLIALPVCLMANTLLFFPVPALVGLPYLFLVGSLAYIAFTIGLVAHQAWGAALARDPETLSRLFGYREVAVITGILGMFLTSAAAEHGLGPGVATKAHAAGAFILVTMVLCTLATAFLTPDPVRPRRKGEAAALGPMKPFLFSNNFMRLFAAALAFDFGWVSYSVLGYFSARYLFGVPDKFALALATTFLVAPLGMMIWMRMARRLGDQKTLVIGSLYTAAAFACLPLLAPAGGTGLLLFSALLGIGFGAGPYLLRSLTGVVSNRFEADRGVSVRGTAYAATTFAGKAGSSFGAVALILVSWLGFDPTGTVEAREAWAIMLVATVVPVCGLLLTAVAVHWARFDEPV